MTPPLGPASTVTRALGTTPASLSRAIRFGVTLDVFGQLAHDNRHREPRGQLGQPNQVGVVGAERAADAEFGQAGDGVAERRDRRVVEHLHKAPFDVLAHHVLPAARLGVHFLPRQADHVDQQPLGEPVLAHDGDGQRAALVGQLQVPVTGNVEQPVALHPRHGLADGGPALLETLGDPRTQRHYALFFEVVDGPQVHLGGIDKIVHKATLRHARVYRPSCANRVATLSCGTAKSPPGCTGGLSGRGR